MRLLVLEIGVEGRKLQLQSPHLLSQCLGISVGRKLLGEGNLCGIAGGLEVEADGGIMGAELLADGAGGLLPFRAVFQPLLDALFIETHERD